MARSNYEVPEDQRLPDITVYERLIGHGLAEAEGRGTAVDHLTARRLAIWLAARPQTPVFARGLVRFIQTGAITRALMTQLRIHARGDFPDRPQAVRLMEYCVARGTDLGPVSEDFAGACNQLDRADAVLADLRERVVHGRGGVELAWPETEGPPIVALVGQNVESQTVSLVLDATTAGIAIFAIAAHADDLEAHVREVERYGQSLPEDSYGRRNRQAIAARDSRVAARLRAVERAYRDATERDAMAEISQPTAPHDLPQPSTDKEVGLE